MSQFHKWGCSGKGLFPSEAALTIWSGIPLLKTILTSSRSLLKCQFQGSLPWPLQIKVTTFSPTSCALVLLYFATIWCVVYLLFVSLSLSPPLERILHEGKNCFVPYYVLSVYNSRLTHIRCSINVDKVNDKASTHCARAQIFCKNTRPDAILVSFSLFSFGQAELGTLYSLL